MRTFREYAAERDQDPIIPQAYAPGAMRSMTQRQSHLWDKMQSSNPDRWRSLYMQPRRLRASVGGNLEQLTSLARNRQDLRRMRTNAQGTLNKVFSAQNARLGANGVDDVE